VERIEPPLHRRAGFEVAGWDGLRWILEGIFDTGAEAAEAAKKVLGRRLGVKVTEHADALEIEPSLPHAGEIETYDDHRIAMSFALLGLRVPGIRIRNPGCVAKTFPDYFTRLERLGGGE